MRRDPLEILEKMFEILEREHEALSINQLAKRTGLNNITVKRYIRIIEMVRSEPDIDIIRTSHSIIIRVERVKDNKELEG